MRKKDEILDNYDDFKSKGRNSTELRTFTELARLEVLIDIRDAVITDCKDAMNALIEIRKDQASLRKPL